MKNLNEKIDKLEFRMELRSQIEQKLDVHFLIELYEQLDNFVCWQLYFESGNQLKNLKTNEKYK